MTSAMSQLALALTDIDDMLNTFQENGSKKWIAFDNDKAGNEVRTSGPDLRQTGSNLPDRIPLNLKQTWKWTQ